MQVQFPAWICSNKARPGGLEINVSGFLFLVLRVGLNPGLSRWFCIMVQVREKVVGKVN